MSESTLSEPAFTPNVPPDGETPGGGQPPLDAPQSGVPAEKTRVRSGRKRWPVVVAALAAVGFLLVFFIGATELLHWTESSQFCSMCHVMAPEFTAYENSAHARAECGTCHIGPGAVPAIKAKLANARYVWVYPTNQYERPIPSPITSLRPVEVVCEQCHWPQKIYADRVVVKNEYGTDKDNSLTQVALNVRTGGGSVAEGYGRGIHWHIDNPVYYIATDEKRQDIPWVSAEYNGVVTEYQSVDSNLTPDALAKYEKRKMDCVDCHNRASHNFRNPSELVDEAITQGTLPKLPYIKDQAVKVLGTQYATETEATAAIAGIADYYKNEQPDVYAQREGDVKTAVNALQDIFDKTQFPFMNVTWESHPNNIGHKDFPGCFRCHDGKHLTSDKQQVIRLECNVCHTIPEEAAPGQTLAAVSAVKPANEPDSHRSTTWLSQHRFQFDASCATCHTIKNPGGSDNSSFCSNGACHGTDWKFVGLNAPQIREISAPAKKPSTGAPATIPHPITADLNCKTCHAADKVVPFPANHASFPIDVCTGCHLPGVAPAAGEPTPVPAPVIQHQVEGIGDCTQCHGRDKVVPFPENHLVFSGEMCLNCHKLAVTSAPSNAPGGVAPKIPHQSAGWENCLLCHDPKTGIKPAPANHEGVPVTLCESCHNPAGAAPAATPAATQQPAPAATPAPSSQPTPAAGGATAAPAIPHDIAGRDNCLLCHDPSGNVKPAPADHAGRTVDTCQTCHKVK